MSTKNSKHIINSRNIHKNGLKSTSKSTSKASKSEESSTLFQCDTNEGYIFKILGDLLQNNIKTACFEIDERGIKLRMMDTHRLILIDLFLDCDKFVQYKFRHKSKIYLGINLAHFHRMIKSVKKRESIKLFIKNDKPTDLGIGIETKETNKTIISSIKIQETQNIEIDLPEGYGRPVNIRSSEFQKMCKGLTQISNQTKIIANKSVITFCVDAGGVMSRSTQFGKADDSDSEDEKEEEYSEEFDTEQLTRITKLAGLGTNIQVFAKNGEPLKLMSNVGSLGTIAIYLKSKNLQQAESHTVESLDDEKE